MRLTAAVEWISETNFIVDGLEFYGDLQTYAARTTADRVVILKYAKLLREYLDYFAPHSIKNLLELGIWQGGSPLFYGMATDAAKVVALDFAPDNPILRDIISRRGLAHPIHRIAAIR